MSVMINHLEITDIFSQDALEPAMRLSLKLQKPGVTLSDSLCWVESAVELISEKKDK